jgi:hypothetical protein
MKIDNNQNIPFKEVHVSKSRTFSYEQKQLIASIKRQLLNGEVKSERGRDLYKKFDNKGYNFFIDSYSFLKKDTVQVYIDKVKTDSQGKKRYEHEYILGSVSRKNLSEFPEKVREFNTFYCENIADTLVIILSLAAACITSCFLLKK